jgi:hypothetical protein
LGQADVNRAPLRTFPEESAAADFSGNALWVAVKQGNEQFAGCQMLLATFMQKPLTNLPVMSVCATGNDWRGGKDGNDGSSEKAVGVESTA